MSNAIINHTTHYSRCPCAGENKKSRADPEQTVQYNEKGINLLPGSIELPSHFIPEINSNLSIFKYFVAFMLATNC